MAAGSVGEGKAAQHKALRWPQPVSGCPGWQADVHVAASQQQLPAGRRRHVLPATPAATCTSARPALLSPTHLPYLQASSGVPPTPDGSEPGSPSPVRIPPLPSPDRVPPLPGPEPEGSVHSGGSERSEGSDHSDDAEGSGGSGSPEGSVHSVHSSDAEGELLPIEAAAHAAAEEAASFLAGEAAVIEVDAVKTTAALRRSVTTAATLLRWNTEVRAWTCSLASFSAFS